MSVRSMNGRQFKKLCDKAHVIITKIQPRLYVDTYCLKKYDDTDDWHHTVLKGTKGFGRVSGYYEPEWSDESAYKALQEAVYWHYCTDPDESYPYGTWSAELPDQNDWRGVIMLGKRIVFAKHAEVMAMKGAA